MGYGFAATSAVVRAESGVIDFLNAYADQAPPTLQSLVGQVLAQLNRASASGATAFGFNP